MINLTRAKMNKTEPKLIYMQNIEHVIMHCPLHTDNRNEMIDTIEQEYVKSNTPFHERQLHLSTLLHPNHTSPQTRHKVNIAIATFLTGVRL